MPLLKLWNALLGRRDVGVQPSVEQPAGEVVHAATTKDETTSPDSTASKPRVRTKPTGRSFHLFGSSPHAALCKLVATTMASSVLEVGVGDGSRAVAIVETLVKRGRNVRYSGIDQFEMTGGEVTLKEFHRTLRAAGIRPQIFPSAVDQGLVQFLHTVGRPDLILFSDPSQVADNPRVRHLITRLSHPETSVLVLQDGTWSRLASPLAEARRAA